MFRSIAITAAAALALGVAAGPASAALPGGNGQLAFETTRDGNYEIYKSDVDGSNATRITNNLAVDQAPAFSPDGTRVAFMSVRDGQYEIYVMNTDGSSTTRLTTNNATDWQPAWSPDGARIVFASNRDAVTNFEI